MGRFLIVSCFEGKALTISVNPWGLVASLLANFACAPAAVGMHIMWTVPDADVVARKPWEPLLGDQASSSLAPYAHNKRIY
ncbi:hypothetical protein PsYK624_127120 [Phanerochaete sordida]|uniref:Uncharacterized protein n=1 Tax=Phanerochaete sordida TaxID=48140 RepID=A0A9P3GJV6_9APHY|nr:hypothetical protein PsYK624_127120 [Phanerochaete sordida]